MTETDLTDIATRLLTDDSAVLAYSEDGHPALARIGVALVAGRVLGLISDLSHHTSALRVAPRASLMFGNPGAKGDPLTHPRLSLKCVAKFVDKAPLRDAFLAARPKATLYFDFTDFHMVWFQPKSAFLNGGFGKAQSYQPEALGLDPDMSEP